MLKAIFPSYDEFISPLSLLKHWLSICNISSGTLFRRILRVGQITNQRLTSESIRLIISVQTLREYFQRENAIEDNAAQNLRGGLSNS